ncbi:MAG: DUF2071 domain-containing protein [Planctomycetota bacterium]
MRLPAIAGVLERRILVNFRIQPDAIDAVLPEPFRATRVKGWAVGGICLIRLSQVRPRTLPRFLGHSSENAAHRIAVDWSDAGRPQHGVFIPRRDTSSRLNACLGGRLFPGEHHRADFEVAESDERVHVAATSRDGSAHMSIEGRRGYEFPTSSIFGSLQEASDFFEAGSLGYSVTSSDGVYDGLELRTFQWEVEPLAVEKVESSFFFDPDRFVPGSVELDCALLMQNVPHEWHSRGSLCCEGQLA